MTLCCADVMGSFDLFEETALRKTAKNTAKHCNGGVGSVVANHHGGGESSVVVTTLLVCVWFYCQMRDMKCFRNGRWRKK